MANDDNMNDDELRSQQDSERSTSNDGMNQQAPQGSGMNPVSSGAAAGAANPVSDAAASTSNVNPAVGAAPTPNGQPMQPPQPSNGQNANFVQQGAGSYAGQPGATNPNQPMPQYPQSGPYAQNAPMQGQPQAGQYPAQPAAGQYQAQQMPNNGNVPFSNSAFPAPSQTQQNWQQGAQNPGAPGAVNGMAMPNGVNGAPGAVPKKSNKAVIAIVTAVVVIVVVVAVVLGLDVAGVIGGPKEKDYKAAQDEIAIMDHNLTAMTTDFVTNSLEASTDGMKDAGTTQFNADKKKFEQANADFKNLKVMKDEKVKSAYDVYAPKAAGFDSYMDDLFKGMKSLSDIKQSCTNPTGGSTVGNDFYHQYDTFFSQCSAKIQSEGKISNKPVANFVQSLQDYLNKKNAILKQMEAMGDPNAMKSNSQIDQLNALVDQFNNIPTPTDDAATFQQAVTKDVSKTDPTRSLKNLQTVVNDGARAKKGSLL
ncbi:hypothetical protein OZX72_03960 [Bifidobacterium sp. ESL0769]|uniref:hypothetical protein n=1 Tax=Bifidobacterium sp. ESL0769 TaxID=2983229 RepID=UPI0023F6F985|nr:hypothetical protein [Bifidobacterium sp. ESL0769]WEV68141.1 hypothetical protein OZX72_03960 [Bifidobacterium sp. ESL0769]